MKCFNSGKILYYQKESLKAITKKQDFRSLFDLVKADLFASYDSSDRKDFDEHLLELLTIFNIENTYEYSRQRKDNPSLTEEDVYPFGPIKGKDITDYLDSLEVEIVEDEQEVEERVDPPKERKRDEPSKKLSNPTKEHLTGSKGKEDNKSKFFIKTNDTLYPTKINGMVALVKEVPTKQGPAYVVAAYLTTKEVQNFGLDEMLKQDGIKVSSNNILFSKRHIPIEDRPDGFTFITVPDFKINTDNPFTVTKSNRTEIQYSSSPSIGEVSGTTLSVFNAAKRTIKSAFNKAFDGIDVLSAFLQIPIRKESGEDRFSMSAVGRPIIRVIAEAGGKLINKTLGVEFKPRPVSKTDSLYVASKRFHDAVKALEELGVKQNDILRYTNEIAKQWSFQTTTNKINKPDKYSKLEEIVGYDSRMLPYFEEIIDTYYGPIEGVLMLNSLREFYNEYGKKITNKERDLVANMFKEQLGIVLSKKTVDAFFDSDDLRSGNILLNTFKPDLGHKLNNTEKNKAPDPALIITGKDGKSATYGELLTTYRKARKELVIVDRGENNEKYLFQFEGQKKQVPLFKTDKLITIYPNRNSVIRVPGRGDNSLTPEFDDQGRVKLQTKPKLRAGGGVLAKDLARLVETTGEDLANVGAIPELEDLFIVDSSNGVRALPLLTNSDSQLKTLLKHHAFKLRTYINNNTTFFLSALGEDFFVKTKDGQLKFKREFDLGDKEIQEAIIEILTARTSKTNSDGTPTPFQGLLDIIEEDNKFIDERIAKEPATMSVLSQIIDDNNYDEQGYWKMTSQKEGSAYSNFYLRRNLSILDTASEFDVDEYGRMSYKDGMNGFGLLSYAYSYLFDPSFKAVYDKNYSDSNFQAKYNLPSKDKLDEYINRTSKAKIKKAFEENLLSQIFSTYNGVNQGGLSVVKGKTEEQAPTPQPEVTTQQAAQQTSASDIERRRQEDLQNGELFLANDGTYGGSRNVSLNFYSEVQINEGNPEGDIRTWDYKNYNGTGIFVNKQLGVAYIVPNKTFTKTPQVFKVFINKSTGRFELTNPRLINRPNIDMIAKAYNVNADAYYNEVLDAVTKYDAELDALEENVSVESTSIEQSDDTFIEENNNTENGDLDFSDPIDQDILIEQSEALAYLKKQFPFANERVLNFLSREAFTEKYRADKIGVFNREGIIELATSSDGKVGIKVLRHEIFHRIFNEYLTPEERKELFDAFKQKYFSDRTFVTIKEFEEAMAVKYQDYERNRNEVGPIQRFFNLILRLFNFIRVNTNSLEEFFDQVEDGKFAVRKSAFKGENRYMTDPLNKMGGIDNYDRAIKTIKKNFYKLMIAGHNLGKFEGVKFNSAIDVRNFIASTIEKQLEKNNAILKDDATTQEERIEAERMVDYLTRYSDNLDDLIQNAFSFVQLDTETDTTSEANLEQEINDKENQNELASSPERVRFWLSNIAKATKEGAEAQGAQFIRMENAFAKLVELTSKIDFNGTTPIKDQLDIAASTLNADPEIEIIKSALLDVINGAKPKKLRYNNIFFINSNTAFITSPDAEFDGFNSSLYDISQLEKSIDDNGNVTYIYREGDLEIAGTVVEKNNNGLKDYLNNVFKATIPTIPGIRSNPDFVDSLFLNIADSYNNAVSAEILKDIVKVITSNRERNPITLVQSTFQSYGVNNTSFQQYSKHNKEYSENSRLRGSLTEGLSNEKLLDALYTGKTYTFERVKPIGQTEEEAEIQADIDAAAAAAGIGSQTSTMAPEYLVHIKNAVSKPIYIKTNYKDVLTSISKIGKFFRLGLDIDSSSNISAAELKNLAELFYDIFQLKKWDKSKKNNPLREELEKEIDVVVGGARTLNTEEVTVNEDEEIDDEDDNPNLIIESQPQGAARYLSQFNFFPLAQATLKKEIKDVSLSERSPDGKDTIYRYVRKSHIFDVVNKLIFSNAPRGQNAPIKLADLNPSLAFLKGDYFQYNPFVTGDDFIYESVFQQGEKTINWAGKEYFKKHANQSIGELITKDLLYFAYYTKVTKGALQYTQTLPQQGDATAHNVLAVDINSAARVKYKIELALNQFLNRPTIEELEEDLGWKPKDYERDHLVDLNILAEAIDNANIKGVKVTPFKDGYKLNADSSITSAANIEKIFASYKELLLSSIDDQLKLILSNSKFRLPGDFFKRIANNKILMNVLETFLNGKEITQFNKDINSLLTGKDDSILNKSGQEVRFKRKKGSEVRNDMYLSKEFISVMRNIMLAQNFNHGVNSYFIDQAVKGPSEFFGSSAGALKRRDSAGSPKESITVQTLDKNGNVVEGTERFARPKFKVVAVNDIVIKDNMKAEFEEIVNKYKEDYGLDETSITELASNLLNSSAEEVNNLLKKVLNKKTISATDRNNALDLAFTYLNDTLSSREVLRRIQGLTDEDLKELDEEYAGTYEPTDGQGFHTTLRNAEIKANAGSNANVGDILKPLHYESIGKYGATVLMKYSSVHLSNEFVQDKPIMARVKENLENLGIDEVVFVSTLKAAKPEGSISFDTLVKKGLSEEDIKGAVIELSNNSYGLQLNPISMSNEISLFTQLLYFPNSTLDDSVESNNQISRINNALSEIYKSKGEVFQSENFRMGMASGRVFTGVAERAVSDNGNVNPKATDLFKSLKQSDDSPYSNPALASTVEKSFLREAHKSTIKTKFPGRKAVLVSAVAVNSFASKEFLLSNEGFDILRKSLKTQTVPAKDKNGNSTYVLQSEALVPRGRWIKDETGKMVWNGIVSPEQQQLIEDAIKNNKPIPDIFLTNYSKNDAMAIRIPTTGIHSGIPLKIKGFYNATQEVNGIIVPEDIVQRHGSDFDVDSLFIISRALFEEDYSFRMKFDEISKSFIDQLGKVKFRDFARQKAFNKVLLRIKEIQQQSQSDRRPATQSEQDTMLQLFRNSEFNRNLIEKLGDEYKEELAIAGFFTREHKDIESTTYQKFRYIFNEDDEFGFVQNDRIEYVGDLALRKKEIENLLKPFKQNTNVRELMKQIGTVEDRIITFRKNTPVGYIPLIGTTPGYRFQDHIDPEDNSKIKSEFLTQIESMLPFVSNSDRKKLVKIKTQYMQNVMVEEFLNIFESPKNRHMMMTTIYMEKFKKWAATNAPKVKFPDSSTILGSNEQRRIATAGRIGTGISAIGIKMLSYFKGYNLSSDVTINALRNGKSIELNRVAVTRDALKELDALVNLNIDNIKELGLYPLNLNENTIGIYISMRLQGLTFEEANFIMTSGLMKSLSNSAGYTPAIVDEMHKNFGDEDTIIDLDKLVSDPTYKNVNKAAIMNVIYKASLLNRDIRELNYIVDSIRSERNTKAELKRLKNLVNKLKNNQYNIITDTFLDNNPHINSAIEVSIKNLRILEQHSINHSPKIDTILSSSVNLKAIKLDKDPIRDDELKRKEIIKYFVSGFVNARNYPEMMINSSRFASNEAFMELMYKRHLQLQTFMRSKEAGDLQGNEFVLNLTSKKAGDVSLLEFEGKTLKSDPSIFYKMEHEFKKLNQVVEKMVFSVNGNEVSIDDISELNNFPTTYDSEGNIIYPQYIRSDFFYDKTSTVRKSQLQQDYFDYEALKSGLDITNRSMTLVFPNEMHIEFHKSYKDLMIKFTQESDPSVLDAITELFDVEFALNNANSMVQSVSAPPVTQVYTVPKVVRGKKTVVVASQTNEKYSYSGYDGRVGYYDLKVPGPAYSIHSFVNPKVSKVVNFRNQLYKLIAQTEDETGDKSMLYYTLIGRPRKQFVYNFRSEMISNLNFIRLKQSLLNITDEIKNISLIEDKIQAIVSINNIDISENDDRGESISSYLAKGDAESISRATDLMTRLHFREQLNNVDPAFYEDQSFQEMIKELARALNINELIINDPKTEIGKLIDVIKDALNSERVNVARTNQYSLETGVPRIKVSSMNVTKMRVGYDFKLEYAFNPQNNQVFKDAEGRPYILAVISNYNDPLNYESKLKKVTMIDQLGGKSKTGDIVQNKFSAIVEISDPSASDLENFTPKTNVVYSTEDNTYSEDALNEALMNKDSFNSPNNPLNNPSC